MEATTLTCFLHPAPASCSGASLHQSTIGPTGFLPQIDKEGRPDSSNHDWPCTIPNKVDPCLPAGAALSTVCFLRCQSTSLQSDPGGLYKCKVHRLYDPVNHAVAPLLLDVSKPRIGRSLPLPNLGLVRTGHIRNSDCRRLSVEEGETKLILTENGLYNSINFYCKLNNYHDSRDIRYD